MTTPRSSHVAVLLTDGRVLVAGGLGAPGSLLSSAEVYDPATGTWTATGSMTTSRFYHTATVLPSGEVLVVGGSTGGVYAPTVLSSMERYSPSAGNWSSASSLVQSRDRHTVSLLPIGQVVVAGGATNTAAVSLTEVQDLSIGTSTRAGNLKEARYFHTVSVLSGGDLLVTGGNTHLITGTLASAELYDPVTGNWSLTGSMVRARARHTATVLQSGDVLVAGGSASAGPVSSAEIYTLPERLPGRFFVPVLLNSATAR